MTSKIEDDIISTTKINTSLSLIKSYLDVLTAFNDTGVSRNDVLGFESSFETDDITSSLGINGFSKNKSRMGLDVAMEGVLNTTLEERTKFIREYFDRTQKLLNENKTIYKVFKQQRDIGEVKNHPTTAKLRAYAGTFDKEWDAVIERNPSIEAVLAETKSTQAMLVVQLEKALLLMGTCKDILYDFLAKPIQRNQGEVELKHYTAYKEIAEYLEMEINLNFANFTRSEYVISDKEISLDTPPDFECLPFIVKQNEFIVGLKSESRKTELKEIPIIGISKLPDSDFINNSISTIEKQHDIISNFLKDSRKELTKDNTQICRLVNKENNDFIIERDVVKLNVLFTDEMFKIVEVLIKTFLELEKLKVSIAHTVLELKTTESKI